MMTFARALVAATLLAHVSGAASQNFGKLLHVRRSAFDGVGRGSWGSGSKGGGGCLEDRTRWRCLVRLPASWRGKFTPEQVYKERQGIDQTCSSFQRATFTRPMASHAPATRCIARARPSFDMHMKPPRPHLREAQLGGVCPFRSFDSTSDGLAWISHTQRRAPLLPVPAEARPALVSRAHLGCALFPFCGVALFFDAGELISRLCCQANPAGHGSNPSVLATIYRTYVCSCRFRRLHYLRPEQQEPPGFYHIRLQGRPG